MSVASVEGELAFIRAAHVHPDPQRPPLLRAVARDHARRAPPGTYDMQRFAIRDLCELPEHEAPTLLEHGFARVDVSALADVAAVLARVRAADRLDPGDVGALRRALRGRMLTTATGTRLRVLHVAREGVLMRRAGPNGLSVARASVPAEPRLDEHDAAENVHIDQDVDGTPLRQLMLGAAPRLLRHDSPSRANTRSRLVVLNLWIALTQVTRPLALMDKRSLDRVRHQLGYAMSTSFVLERPSARAINDLWVLLPDPEQRWSFSSRLELGQGYLFETLSTPHGAFIVPGEDVAEQLYLALDRARSALADTDADALARALALAPTQVGVTTASLASAIATMAALLDEARARAATLLEPRVGDDWSARAAAAMQVVVRRSIELRVLAWLPG
jgi:hypothetical protein